LEDGLKQDLLLIGSDLVEGQKELVDKLVAKKWEFVGAAKALHQLKEEFMKLIRTWVVVPEEMLKVVAATALLFGYKNEELYPKRKKELSWEVLCKTMDDKFFQIIQEAADIAKEQLDLFEDKPAAEGEEPAPVKKKTSIVPSRADVLREKKAIEPAQKMKSIKDFILTDYDDQKALNLAPALKLLYDVLNGAYRYRESHLRWVKDQYTKRKEKAEADAEDFSETKLEDRDDDFEELETES